MGFLSKLFGGDAGSASSKAGDELATPLAREEPSAGGRKPVMTGEHRADPGVDTPRRAPPAATLAEAASAAGPAARAPAANVEHETPRSTLQPSLGAGPHGALVAPRPALGAKPRAAAEPPKATPPEAARANVATAPGLVPRATLSTVTGEAELLGPSRSRKDRSKSPGFYSNMAPAFGAQMISPGASQSIKRTAIGLPAPPDAVEEGSGAATPGALVHDGASRSREASPLPIDAAPAVTPANDADEVPDSAPPRAATGELEQDQTSPGVGHTPSRYDPVVRSAIPERDLDVLVHFVMDLSLGLASEAWLAPVRDALGRLKAAALRLQRGALGKALVQFGVEIDASSALTEERRARIVQQLVLVDLALPRPMDVSGQRSLRERLIVQHLLNELSIAHPLVAQRLRDEGTSSLERFTRLAAAELAEQVGISAEQADQALLPIREYLLERARRGPELWLLGKARALEQRLAELEASARQFESAADSDDVHAKRVARRKRQADIVRVSLFLAECGEAGILAEFERSSVQGKIARLRRWLGEIQAS
jgi:hypothetical protein